MTSGVFITLEGIDGSGKTTQARRIAGLIADREVVSVREPGSTALAERVRAVLLDPAAGAVDPRAELLLYVACRAQLVGEVIRPALERGAVVLSDRFADSTLAYQGYGRCLGPDVVRKANEVATGGLVPALTFVIDLPVEIALVRRSGSPVDRLEAETRSFHERVRAGFLEIARGEPDRVVVIDGTRSPDEVTAEIAGLITRWFPELLSGQQQSIEGT